MQNSSPESRRMLRELSDLSGGTVGDAADDDEDAGQEFASAPAATLRRVIFKLFPLPKPPASVLQAQKQQRAALRLQTMEMDRRQRACRLAQSGPSSRPAPAPPAPKGQLKRKFTAAESSGSEDLFTDDDSVKEMLKRSNASSNKRQRGGAGAQSERTAGSSQDSDSEGGGNGSDSVAPNSPAAKLPAPVVSPFKAPRGKAKGYKGWSIFRSEGWLLASSSDKEAHSQDLQDVLHAEKAKLGPSGYTTEFVAAVTQEAAQGAKHVNQTIAKTFKRAGKLRGEIVAYLPATLNDGEELWHVVFSDLDEEDWDADEVSACF